MIIIIYTTKTTIVTMAPASRRARQPETIRDRMDNWWWTLREMSLYMGVGGLSDHLVSHFRTLSPKTYDRDDEDVEIMDVLITREIKPSTVDYESCYDVVRGRRKSALYRLYLTEPLYSGVSQSLESWSMCVFGGEDIKTCHQPEVLK